MNHLLPGEVENSRGLEIPHHSIPVTLNNRRLTSHDNIPEGNENVHVNFIIADIIAAREILLTKTRTSENGNTKQT